MTPLGDELAAVAAAVADFAEEGERVEGVLAVETVRGERVYLCSFERDERRSWLLVDAAGGRIHDRELVHEAASLAALCELAEETAGGGHLEQLRTELLRLRLTEAPEGIEEAEAAALTLEHAIEPAPRVASAAYLDRIGEAARALERALGESGNSPFGAAMQASAAAVGELMAAVEARYRGALR
jgi:hypothetical protein